MDQEEYTTFHEGKGMKQCDCGAFLTESGICPSCY